MEYKVVGFVPSLKQEGKEKVLLVAPQLEEVINKYAKEGWSYVRLEQVTTHVKGTDGCFGIGAKPASITSRQMIVFRKG